MKVNVFLNFKHSLQSWDLCPRLLRGDFYPAENGEFLTAIDNWQAKEISRIVKEYNPEEAGIDISLLAHISPIEWSNVVLYGEYKLNKDLVRL